MTTAHLMAATTTVGPPPVVIDRRRLLLGGVTLAGVALLGREFSLRSASTTINSNGSNPSLSASTFVPHVGTVFLVATSEFGTVPLRLVESLAFRSHPSEPPLIGGDAFGLVFEGPSQFVLPASTYQFGHEILDLPPWYVSPIGRNVVAKDYQVVVDNRTFEAGDRQRKAG